MNEVKAIERYVERRKQEFESGDIQLPLTTWEAMAAAYNDVLVFIQDMPGTRKSGWIPCSERLPSCDNNSDYYDSVIATLSDGTVTPGVYINEDEVWWCKAKDGRNTYMLNSEVIAWRPLPQAYEEGDTE